MAQTYDLILKGATVVNHDGEGMRDIEGSRAAGLQLLASLQAGRRVKPSIAAASTCCRA